ncbi:class II glutamine amidotransferase [Kibdelosporangium phytohabitans]|uniref:Glutamine amidotransferase type-2 domain-containing protein n=1 Tax=Kibdelosporangium phytohabitans TaxID=860235 RepID=A0A0N9HTV3_9PSEU|nr:class II glutamine amidotransferase [Kibdelosporangium phytohabitans]ALG06342.1 hypothetical protein AOZ06_04870 [Kibdelosporangium phytohabitans]MBE1467478.1 glutamine amidotransferase [Kibdelosporangium phytohabitans]
MLTFFPENVMPDAQALINGAVINSDGHGFAIVADGRILVERDMGAQRLIEQFVAVRETYPDGPALFHSRIATAGEITVANCHPFRVGGDVSTVLAHNGTMPARVQPAKDDPRSDTRILAEDFLATEPFGPLGTRRARKRMEKWLSRRNKVVILTVDPRYDHQAYVLHEDAGVWDNGIWYSNKDYQRNLSTYGQWYDDVCPMCEVPPGPDEVDRVCRACGVCLVCYEWEDNCVCDPPARVRHELGLDWDLWGHRRAWSAGAVRDTSEDPDDYAGPVAV